MPLKDLQQKVRVEGKKLTLSPQISAELYHFLTCRTFS